MPGSRRERPGERKLDRDLGPTTSRVRQNSAGSVRAGQPQHWGVIGTGDSQVPGQSLGTSFRREDVCPPKPLNR